MLPTGTVDEVDGTDGVVEIVVGADDTASRLVDLTLEEQDIKGLQDGFEMRKHHDVAERNASSQLGSASTASIPASLIDDDKEEGAHVVEPYVVSHRHQLHARRIVEFYQETSNRAQDGYDLCNRQLDLQKQRSETVAVRFNLIGQRSELQHRLAAFHEVGEKLLTQLNILLAGDTEAPHVAGLASSLQGIRHSFDHLHQQIEQTKAMEQQLNTLECEFGIKENKLFSDLGFAFLSMAQTANNPRPAEDGVDEAGEPPNVLRAYYDMNSEIPILEEKLADLEQAFNDERAQREIRGNLGQAIFPPDLEFYAEYHEEKDGLQRELLHTRSDAARLRSECVQLGLLSPTPPTQPRPYPTDPIMLAPEHAMRKSRSYSHFSQGAEKPGKTILSDGDGAPQPSMPLLLPKFANPRDRINEWLVGAHDAAGPPEAVTSDTLDAVSNQPTGASSNCGSDVNVHLSPQALSVRSW